MLRAVDNIPYMRAMVLLMAAALTVSAEFRLGRGQAKITPPAGMPMGGGFTVRLSTGVHDDLFCKALLFDLDGARAATVTCDVESLHRPTIEAARRAIEEITPLRGHQAMITATHSHSGPEMTPLVLDGATGEAARFAKAYHEELPRRIAEAVRAALDNLAPARIAAGVTHERDISFNRRFHMTDGGVRTNPGQMNADIVRDAGPIDPELRIAYFDTPEAKPLATAVNFALHTTSWGGPTISADYPGILTRLLAAAKSPEMATVFLQGCSGNINQVNVKTREKQSGPEVANRIATILAADVIRAYPQLESVPVGSLAVRSVTVNLPVPYYADEERDRAWEAIRKSRAPGPGQPKFLDLVHAFRVVNVVENHRRSPIPAEVQAIAFGNRMAWVGLPGEVFAELGMAIKRASPFPHTFVNELANDMLDYVPDRKAFPQGGYEPTTARCVAGCGELLVDAATRMLVEMFEAGR